MQRPGANVIVTKTLASSSTLVEVMVWEARWHMRHDYSTMVIGCETTYTLSDPLNTSAHLIMVLAILFRGRSTQRRYLCA